MLSDRLVYVGVSDVGVLWPNGWMDQDETWHGGRPRTRPLCVRLGPSSPSLKGAQPPIFGPCLLCQAALWIKMPLGTEVGLIPHDILLMGTPLPQKRGHSIPHFLAHVAKQLDGWRDQDAIWYAGRLQPRPQCVRWGPSSSQKGNSSPLPNLRPMSIVAKWLDGSRCHLVRR